MIHFFSSFLNRSRRTNRKRRPFGERGRHRRLEIETLESRQLLSVTLPTPANQSIVAGDGPLNVAINGSDTAGDAVSYTVNVVSSTLSSPVTATVMPSTNPTMTIAVTGTSPDGTTFSGDMVFSLFSNYVSTAVSPISTLANEGFYNGLQFFRVDSSSGLAQTGSPTNNGQGGSGTSFDDDYNSNLQFTGPGMLALANSGPNTNSSQFFITSGATPYAYGNFRYTILGTLVSGSNILADLMAVNVSTNSTTGFPDPTSAVTMTSVTMSTDNQDAVLQLSAAAGTTGSEVVTVTATSVENGVTQTATSGKFTLTAASQSYTDPPSINRPVSPITATAGTSVPFTIAATNASGGTVTYAATSSNTSAMTVTQNATTPSDWTLDPTAAGVYYVTESVTATSPASSENTTADTLDVPVYVDPAAPTVALASGGTVTNLSNTPDKPLQFDVNGLAGTTASPVTVDLYSGTTLIGSASASGASVEVTANSSFTLTSGTTYTITATQALEDQKVSVGNLSTTTNLVSPSSTALSITFDQTAPVFSALTEDATSATAGIAYSYTVSATDSAGTLTYSLVSSVNGMSINSTSGLINWLAGDVEGGAVGVDVEATDPAGNTAQQQFVIDVNPLNIAPVLSAASPSLGTIDLNTPLVTPLSAFINNTAGSTTITDPILGAVVGGIAVTGATGGGTWAFELSGQTTFTNFSTLGTLSTGNALLLPATASLEYTPGGSDGLTGTPSITYIAWDQPSGVTGGTTVSLTASGATGGSTNYSLLTTTDTASITVNDVTENTADSVILTAAHPSLGSASASLSSTKTILLTSFINNATAASTTISYASAAEGSIAVTGVTGLGTWAYSEDGTDFTDITASLLSPTNAILLPASATASLRYTSSGENETATITYCGWNGTGTAVNTTVNGNDAAFSLLSDTASLTVNDAPILTPASSPASLGNTTGGTALSSVSLSSFIDSGSGSTEIADTDTNAKIGIALTAATGGGTWAYELSGQSAYTPILAGSLSTSNALLLPITGTLLQYTPDFNSETPSITYVGWDRTTGIAGGYADLTTTGTGGFTAFSSSTTLGTASLTVNDAPVLTKIGPSLGSITTTVTASTATPISLSTFINNTNGTMITDPDKSAGTELGGIAVTAISGSGTWEYSTGSGFNTISGSSLSSTNVLLLSSTSQIEYIPQAGISGSASITYYAWEEGSGSGEPGSVVPVPTTGGTTDFSTATDTATLTVNDAPTLTSAAITSLGSFTTYTSTATATTLTTSNLNTQNITVAKLANSTTITEPDSGTEDGIALTGISGNGTWSYELSGSSTLINLAAGTVSPSAAVLLPTGASLDYTPSAAGDSASITYLAWDPPSGNLGGTTANLSAAGATGGATPFSSLTAAVTASLIFNQAPVLTAAPSPSLGSTTVNTAVTFPLTGIYANSGIKTFINSGINTTIITDFDSGAALGGIALTGASVSGSGVWAYSVNGSTFTNIGSSTTGALSTSNALLLPANASLRYTPDGTATGSASIKYIAWDAPSGATVESGVDLTAAAATGGFTAYSALATTDTATLTVASYSTLSGYVYIDPTNTAGSWTASSKGVGGATVRLLLENSSGTFAEVSGSSPTQTESDGYYSFGGLDPGTYQIQETLPTGRSGQLFVNGQDTLGSISGTNPQADLFQVTVSAGQDGTGYNFGVQGEEPRIVCANLLLFFSNFSVSMTTDELIQNLQTAPTVNLAGSSGSTATTNFSTQVSSHGASVAIASSAASISSPDSPTLTSMTVTLTDRPDGSHEQLAAATTGTSITASPYDPATGVLSLAGVADTSTYQTVLQSITYSDTATSPTTGDRTIDVVVDDGILSSDAAVSTVDVLPVGLGATTIGVTASDSTVAYGQSVTFTATVSPSSGSTTPTGTVTFTSGTTTLGKETLSDGVATLSTSALAVGSDTVTASYGGDSNYSANSGTCTETVTQTTTTTLTASPNPAVYGQPVTLTAAVSPFPSSTTSTETVTFKSGSTTLGTGPLNSSGVATLSTSELAQGSDAVTATYGGDSIYDTSTGTLTLPVLQATTTTLATDATSPVAGQYVAFTATVSPASGSGTPTGKVNFFDGSTNIGTETLDSDGVATLTTHTLAADTGSSQSITASYVGDSNFGPSTSAAQSETVGTVGTAGTDIEGGLTPDGTSAAPLSAGQPVTFTVVVTATDPTGSNTPSGVMTFLDDNDGTTTVLGTEPLVSGATGEATVTFTTSTLPAGSNMITAAYSGDAVFAANPVQLQPAEVIDAAGTTPVTVTLAPSSSSSGTPTVNESVSFTATVTGATTPTGVVNLISDGVILDTEPLAAGATAGEATATFTTSALTAGSDILTASYGGVTPYAANSGPYTEDVAQATTTTTLAASATSAVVGQDVTFTATVTPSQTGSITPTGQVTFLDSGQSIGTGTLNSSGVATFTTPALAVDAGSPHSITASYAGDTNFSSSDSSSNPVSVEVDAVGTNETTTALAASPNHGTVGESVTFTATVTDPTAAGTPTGTVTFLVGTTPLGSVSLVAGSTTGVATATFSTSALTAGSNAITASYGGSSVSAGNYAASSNTSNGGSTLTETIAQGDTTTTVSASASPAVTGQYVTFTATVTPSTGGSIIPSGTVTFVNNSTSPATTLGTGTLNSSGVATCTKALPEGVQSITATYSGDTNYTTSSAPLLEQVNLVGTIKTTTTVVASPSPGTAGQSVTFTATVKDPTSSGTPTGTVTFLVGTTILGWANLVPSPTVGVATATFSTSALTQGSNSITASYSGTSISTSNYAGSSGTGSETIS